MNREHQTFNLTISHPPTSSNIECQCRCISEWSLVVEQQMSVHLQHISVRCDGCCSQHSRKRHITFDSSSASVTSTMQNGSVAKYLVCGILHNCDMYSTNSLCHFSNVDRFANTMPTLIRQSNKQVETPIKRSLKQSIKATSEHCL